MRYWDASALVPLVVSEVHTARVRRWLETDPHVVTWGWTRVEIRSAVERRARAGELTRADRRLLLARFDALASCWDEIVDVLAVRTRALQVLARHSIRAADAAQLGAALLLGEAEPSSVEFVCLDVRLAAAAELEGLRVLGADEPSAS